jgi:hypothetical protein
MHDPMTLAWKIKYPWARRTKSGLFKGQRFRDNFIEIWHVDPEDGPGGDDSCGWFSPYLNEKQVEECGSIAKDMMIDVFRDTDGDGVHLLRSSQESATYSAYIRVLWRVFKKKKLNHKHLSSAMSLMFNYFDNLLFLCPEGRGIRQDDVVRFVCLVARSVARVERPWWRHPRYHVHHFKVNVIPLRKLVRWLFSRCCRCGKGFSWGYAPVSEQWDGDGPRWFRGEKSVRHHDCGNPKSNGCCAAKAGV